MKIMQGKKAKLAKIFEKSKIIKFLGRINYSSLTIINYHRIYEEPLTTNYDKDVYGPDVDEFKAQMTWLKENCKILSESDLINVIDKGCFLKKQNVVITFDDGYIDNYTLAYPILKLLDIPAIFFIPTGSINERKLGWWDIIAYCVNNCSFNLIEYNDYYLSLADNQSRQKTIRFFISIMKKFKDKETAHLVETIADSCKVPVPTDEMQSREIMTWDQIKEVAKNGITIGSHAHSHRVLSTIEPDEQKHELIESKKILEENLNLDIKSLAYPVGGPESFTEETKKFANEAGFKIAFSFNTGINRALKDPYNIKRISPPVLIHHYKATVLMPYLFH